MSSETTSTKNLRVETTFITLCSCRTAAHLRRLSPRLLAATPRSRAATPRSCAATPRSFHYGAALHRSSPPHRRSVYSSRRSSVQSDNIFRKKVYSSRRSSVQSTTNLTKQSTLRATMRINNRTLHVHSRFLQGHRRHAALYLAASSSNKIRAPRFVPWSRLPDLRLGLQGGGAGRV